MQNLKVMKRNVQKCDRIPWENTKRNEIRDKIQYSYKLKFSEEKRGHKRWKPKSRKVYKKLDAKSANKREGWEGRNNRVMIFRATALLSKSSTRQKETDATSRCLYSSNNGGVISSTGNNFTDSKTRGLKLLEIKPIRTNHQCREWNETSPFFPGRMVGLTHVQVRNLCTRRWNSGLSFSKRRRHISRVLTIVDESKKEKGINGVSTSLHDYFWHSSNKSERVAEGADSNGRGGSRLAGCKTQEYHFEVDIEPVWTFIREDFIVSSNFSSSSPYNLKKKDKFQSISNLKNGRALNFQSVRKRKIINRILKGLKTK